MNDRVTKDPLKDWAPYVPDKDAPWNLRRVVHLHSRAGFAASWPELQRDLRDGPDRSIARVLSGKSTLSTPTSFALLADRLRDVAEYPDTLKAWWIYRMLLGPDPLGERLTLMWHDHFATSFQKVRDLPAMRQQNEMFRKHARGSFVKLLSAALRDPALLLFLDAPHNRKGKPNENLARELMELFTLGIGPYTERDVKEAARALTGWSVVEGKFRQVPTHHDDGEKTILGKRGRWNGGDLLTILLEHPATARRLVDRLCALFMGEKVVSDVARTALANELRKHKLGMGWAVATILRSRLFFSQDNLGTRVLGPTEYVVGATRALEMGENPPSTLALADWIRRLGQDLFNPPNVGGWPGGRNWLSPRTLIGRARFASDLVEGRLNRNRQPFDALGLARRYGRGNTLEDVMQFYFELREGKAPEKDQQTRLLTALGKDPGLTPQNARKIVTLILALPDGQLG